MQQHEGIVTHWSDTGSRIRFLDISVYKSEISYHLPKRQEQAVPFLLSTRSILPLDEHFDRLLFCCHHLHAISDNNNFRAICNTWFLFRFHLQFSPGCYQMRFPVARCNHHHFVLEAMGIGWPSWLLPSKEGHPACLHCLGWDLGRVHSSFLGRQPHDVLGCCEPQKPNCYGRK